MRKKTVLSFPFIFLGLLNAGQAQQKMLSMEDAFLNRNLNPENLSNLSWIPQSNIYSFTAKKDEVDFLVSADAKGGKKDTLLSAAYSKGVHTEMSDKRFPGIS